MRRQNLAEKTRRAYGVDLGQLAEWASRAGPGARAAGLQGAAAVRRRAVRARHVALHRGPQAGLDAVVLRPAGARGADGGQPGGPGVLAQARPAPAHGAQAGRADRAAGVDARLHAAGAARPRHVRADLLRRPARRGGRGPGPGQPGSGRRGAARGGQGRQDQGRARRRARVARAAGLARARAPPAGARGRPRAVPVQDRPQAVHVGRAAAPGGRRQARRDPGRGVPAHAPALVRDPPAGGRRGSAQHPGAARTCVDQHDPDLHSGRVAASEDGRTRRLIPEPEGQRSSGNQRQGHRATRPVAPLQGKRRPARARAPGPGLLAAGQVRGRAHVQRPARPRGGGRPDLVRPAGPDLGHRALRARPRDPLRDLRHHPHQGLDHRRAALAGLGPALGAGQGARDRARQRQARAQAAPRAHRPGDGRPSSRWSSRTSRSR